jgi:cobalamin biosynthesis protein CobC
MPNLPVVRPDRIAHGGRLNQARTLFPNAPEPFLDLSTGINPLAYPLPQLAAECFTRLPEPEAEAALLTAAAAAYGAADPSLIAAAPGTQILIDLIPRLWPSAAVSVLGPTYAEHAQSWRKIGALVTTISDPAALEAVAQQRGAVIVLCNPNNPDGQRITPSRLLALANRLAAGEGLLLVDEAFADLEDDSLSLVRSLPHPAVIVLRSFGKTFGLAGVRLGFALATPDRAQQISQALGPWAVSGPAIAIGRAALGNRAWLETTRRRLDQETVMLDAMLTRAGFRVIGGTALFRLGECSHAATIFQRLGQAGILVRRFAEQPNWLRFGLPGPPEAWRRLDAALGQ